MQPVTLYDHPIWQELSEKAMRPGGLALTGQVLAFCDFAPGACLLDLGCGAGATLNYLDAECSFTTYGIDASSGLLSRARQSLSGNRLVQARGEYLPVAGASLDGIIAECVLSILDMDTALAECMRILKPGGYLIASDLYARNENGLAALRQLPPGTCISSAMTRMQIVEIFESRGLKIMLWQDCSEKLKEFPVCTLTTAAAMDPLDMVLAAAQARLGYYSLVARKV